MKKSVLAFTVLVILALMAPLQLFAFDEGEPVLVVLSANWCAKCRDLKTVIPDVLTQLSKQDMRIVTLDADNETTPQLAKRYGIRLEGSDLPQVYLYQQGKTALVLNSADYAVGHPEQATSKLLKNLGQY